MMVIMALVTTALTTPMLHWVYPASMEWEKQADRAKAKSFTVLVPVSLPESAGPLIRLAQTLAPLADAPRQIIALFLRRPSDRIYRTDLDEVESPTGAGPLASVIAGLPVETVSFTSRDVPSDIARVARIRQADIILMGYHKPVFGQAILGGTVHRVLTGSDTDVGIFVNRGYESHKPILVPYLGGPHDRLALELAGRIARDNSAAITVLHVVPPDRIDTEQTLHARGVVEKTFADPTTKTAVVFKVIHDPSPAVAVVRESAAFGLVVIGVEEQWGLESQLFGWRQQWIANQCPVSMLIVRKHTRLGLPPNPDHDVTPGETSLEEPTPLGTAQPNSSPAAAPAPATADIVPITPPNPAPPAPATILPPTV
jgi:nucleotide-binding universal stress UspA family protein